MKQIDIDVTKTARFFVLGEEVANVERIIFVLHGYAQLANYFLRNFEPLDDGRTLIVAPEGLHRFYWNGFSGRVVASWMTKEDRQIDIQDYVNYLDQVAMEVIKPLPGNVNLQVIGFSQGAATAVRWLALGKTIISQLTLWAGAFPEDMEHFTSSGIFENKDVKLVVGDADQFIDEAMVLAMREQLDSLSIEHELIRFKGKHEIHGPTLLEIYRNM